MGCSYGRGEVMDEWDVYIYDPEIHNDDDNYYDDIEDEDSDYYLDEGEDE